jgi:hypothetical protein
VGAQFAEVVSLGENGNHSGMRAQLDFPNGGESRLRRYRGSPLRRRDLGDEPISFESHNCLGTFPGLLCVNQADCRCRCLKRFPRSWSRADHEERRFKFEKARCQKSEARLDCAGLAESSGRVVMPFWMMARTSSRSGPTSGNRGARTTSEPKPHSCCASLMYCTSLT